MTDDELGARMLVSEKIAFSQMTARQLAEHLVITERLIEEADLDFGTDVALCQSSWAIVQEMRRRGLRDGHKENTHEN